MISKKDIHESLSEDIKAVKKQIRSHPTTRVGQRVKPLPGMTNGMELHPSKMSTPMLPPNIRRQWSF